MQAPVSRWESPHQRRLLGPATISDDAFLALRERLLEQRAIREAYLVEIEIIEPIRGSSRASNLALWLEGEGPDIEMEVEKGLVVREALAGIREFASLELSFLAPAGLAAARRRGLRVL
jgi:hypothetical protein